MGIECDPARGEPHRDDPISPQPRRVAAHLWRHHVPVTEDESAAARSGAGEDHDLPADHVDVHDGAVPGRAGDLLGMEQPAEDRTAIAAQVAGPTPGKACGQKAETEARAEPGSAEDREAVRAEAGAAEDREAARAEAAEALGAHQGGKAKLGTTFTAS